MVSKNWWIAIGLIGLVYVLAALFAQYRNLRRDMRLMYDLFDGEDDQPP